MRWLCIPPPSDREINPWSIYKCKGTFHFSLFHFLMLLAGGDFIKSLPEIGNLSYLDNDLAPLPGIEKKITFAPSDVDTSPSKIDSRKNWAMLGIFSTYVITKFHCNFHLFRLRPKPSLKIRTANAICWNFLGLFRDYGLNYIFFRNTTFLSFKIESWNFQHLFEINFVKPHKISTQPKNE